MLERRHQAIAPLPVFLLRLLRFVGIAILLILAALAIGVSGYHWIAGLSWIDSFLNASMILSGMGPVNVLINPAAKIFASLYALFSGVVFIAVMGIILAPIAHRILHRFHLEGKER